MIRIRVTYDRSIRCHLGRHERVFVNWEDYRRGCQGGFTPVLGGGVAKFCLCQCHDAAPEEA